MKNPSSWKRRLWLGLGVILLSSSLFFYFILILISINNPSLWTGFLFLGIILIVPTGLGIFFIRRGNKPEGLVESEIKQSTIEHKVGYIPSPTPNVSGKRWLFWIGICLLLICILIWFLFIRVVVEDPEANLSNVMIFGIIITLVPFLLGIYFVKRGRKLTYERSERIMTR